MNNSKKVIRMYNTDEFYFDLKIKFLLKSEQKCIMNVFISFIFTKYLKDLDFITM